MSDPSDIPSGHPDDPIVMAYSRAMEEAERPPDADDAGRDEDASRAEDPSDREPPADTIDWDRGKALRRRARDRYRQCPAFSRALRR